MDALVSLEIFNVYLSLVEVHSLKTSARTDELLMSWLGVPSTLKNMYFFGFCVYTY